MKNNSETRIVNGRAAIFDVELEYDSRDDYGRWERPRCIIYLESVDGIPYASLDADVSDDTIEALYEMFKDGSAEYDEIVDRENERALDQYDRMYGHFPY